MVWYSFFVLVGFSSPLTVVEGFSFSVFSFHPIGRIRSRPNVFAIRQGRQALFLTCPKWQMGSAE
jgi:hypothetical protein